MSLFLELNNMLNLTVILLLILMATANLTIQSLYTENRIPVFDYILRNSGSEDDAADIFQDGVIIFWQKLKNPDFKLTVSRTTFLISICKNLWLNELRNKRKNLTVVKDDIPDVEMEDDDLSENEVRQNKLNKAIELLGDTCRTILKAFYYETLSMEEIAVKAKLSSAKTAKSKKYKCIQQLKAKMI